MRLWSIHPKYLDSQGLVSLWREALLAQKVLCRRTKAFKNHPQLQRFLENKDPMAAIGQYLLMVFSEASKRGYKFNKKKIQKAGRGKISISVTRGQLKFEFNHLLNKLRKRDRSLYMRLKNIRKIEANPVFKVISGNVQSWEKGRTKLKPPWRRFK